MATLVVHHRHLLGGECPGGLVGLAHFLKSVSASESLLMLRIARRRPNEHLAQCSQVQNAPLRHTMVPLIRPLKAGENPPIKGEFPCLGAKNRVAIYPHATTPVADTLAQGQQGWLKRLKSPGATAPSIHGWVAQRSARPATTAMPRSARQCVASASSGGTDKLATERRTPTGSFRVAGTHYPSRPVRPMGGVASGGR